MISKMNPNYGGEEERESFHRLRENKLYLLRTICAKTLKYLDDTLREYARIERPHMGGKPAQAETSPEIIRARRRRYYEFLRWEQRLKGSDGDYPAEKQAFLSYYSLNLPPDCLDPLCERYTKRSKKVQEEFNSKRENIDQLTAAITEHNLGLVRNLSWKMWRHLQIDSRSDPEIDELLQAGNLGLLIAIHKYDLSKGNRFSTYASWWIRQEIQKYLSSAIKRGARLVSLSRSLNEDGDLTLEDCLEDESTPTPEEYALSTAGGKSREKLFPPSISHRDREVMEFLFGFYDGKEHDRKEAARRFGVSSSCIGLIYHTSLRKMRKHFLFREVSNRFKRDF